MIALWMVYATVVAGIIGIAAAILERASAGTLRQRRGIWVTALVASAAVPAWAALEPLRERSSPPVGRSGGAAGAPRAVTTDGWIATRLAQVAERTDTTAIASYDSTLALTWLAVAALALAGYGIGTWSLASRRRGWRVATVDGHDVLVSATVGPAVIGTIRPRIVVPEWALGLSPAERALMLEHERQHIAARDPLLLHGAAMVALLMPWNVMAWWLTRRLRLAVELDCDARVLSRGGDVRAYGTLLLDVCSRRVRGGPPLAPALFARTSSLTRRILAMHPGRVTYPRMRAALGVVVVLAATVVACEMPSPEMLAPDGKDLASTRVFGTIVAATADTGIAYLQKTVAERFPDVARGDGGPTILYIVKSPGAGIVLTASQPAEGARVPASAASATGSPSSDRTALRVRATELTPESREAVLIRDGARVAPLRVKTAAPGDRRGVPEGIGALRPDDIASIDVSKFAAGKIAPKPVSIILIELKPNAKIPLRPSSR